MCVSSLPSCSEILANMCLITVWKLKIKQDKQEDLRVMELRAGTHFPPSFCLNVSLTSHLI